MKSAKTLNTQPDKNSARSSGQKPRRKHFSKRPSSSHAQPVTLTKKKTSSINNQQQALHNIMQLQSIQKARTSKKGSVNKMHTVKINPKYSLKGNDYEIRIDDGGVIFENELLMKN